MCIRDSHQIARNDPFSNYWLSINFWDINLIFDSGKTWDCIFWDGKVFYPIKKFFTHILTSSKSEKLKSLKIQFVASSAQKGGKKLSEGVKNFLMIKSNVSAFSWTKNHTFIWQTHPYSSNQTTAAKSHLGVRSGVSPLIHAFCIPKCAQQYMRLALRTVVKILFISIHRIKSINEFPMP